MADEILVDEILAHLSGVASEYAVGPRGALLTGGGAATVDVARTSGGKIRLSVSCAGRTIVVEVEERDWDASGVRAMFPGVGGGGERPLS